METPAVPVATVSSHHHHHHPNSASGLQQQRLVMLEERVQLERLRASVFKEQADLRVERAHWERDRLRAERDELARQLERRRTPFAPQFGRGGGGRPYRAQRGDTEETVIME